MEKQKREVVVIEIEIRRRKKKHWNLDLVVLDTVDLSYSDLIGCDLEETVSPLIMCN